MSPMRSLALVLAFTACGLAGARADDAAACRVGIAEIRAALDKAPPEPAAGRLRKALRVAEREAREGEFDECLDAVRDARAGR